MVDIIFISWLVNNDYIVVGFNVVSSVNRLVIRGLRKPSNSLIGIEIVFLLNNSTNWPWDLTTSVPHSHLMLC